MSEREIKTTLTLDGADKFNKELRSADSELKILAKELGNLTSNYNSNIKSMSSLASQQKNLKDQVAINESKVRGLGDAVTSQTAKYKEQKSELERLIREQGAESDEVIKQAKEVRSAEIELDKYRRQLADSETALMKSRSALNSFNEENGRTKLGQAFTAGKAAISEFGEKVSAVSDKFRPLTSAVKEVTTAAAKISFKAAESGAKAFAATVETGMKAAYSALGTYTKTVAAASVTAFSGAAAGAAALTKSVISAASELSEYGDNIDKMSQKMGMSAEAYQEWDAIMQHNGLSIDSLKSSMKTLATAAETGSDAFSRLGISQEQISSMSQEELFSATISALQNVENETERTYLASKVLGKGATELGALLNSSAEETEALRQRVHDLGGIMSDDTVKASARFADDLQDMKTAISGVKRSITAEFLPGLSSMMEGIAKVYAGEEGGAELLDKGVDEMIGSIDRVSDRIADMADKSVPIIEAALNGIGKVVQKSVPVIVKKIPPLVEKVVPQLVKTSANILSELTKNVSALMPKFMSDTLPGLVSAAQSRLPGVVRSLTSAVNGTVLALGDVVIAALPVITDTIIPELIAGAVDLITGITEKLPDFLPIVIDGAETLFFGLIDGLNTVADTLLPLIPGLITDAASSLTESLPVFLGSSIELFGKLIEGLDSVIEALLPMIPDLVKNAADTIVTNAPTLLSSAESLFGKLLTALEKTTEQLLPKLPQLVSDMGKKITDNIGTIISAGTDLLTGLIDGIADAVPTLMQESTRIVVQTALELTKKENLGRLLSAGAKLIKKMAEGFPDAIKYIGENLPEIINNIWDSLMEVDWLDLGVNIVKGILEGFLNLGDIIWDYVSDLGSQIEGSIKDFFGISSPSKLMRDEVGVYLAEGVAVGFTDNMDKLADDMAESIPHDFDTSVNISRSMNVIDSISSAQPRDSRSVSIYINIAEASLGNRADIRSTAEMLAKEAQSQLFAVGMR